MRLECRLNGRRVPARDIGRELAREMERRTRAALDRRARSTRSAIPPANDLNGPKDKEQ